MTTMDLVKEPLEWFFSRVYEKMSSPKNVAKGHWGKMTKREILHRILDEVKEADDEIDPERQIKEFCDIAAFAMMGADNARRRLANPASPKKRPPYADEPCPANVSGQHGFISGECVSCGAAEDIFKPAPSQDEKCENSPADVASRVWSQRYVRTSDDQ